MLQFSNHIYSTYAYLDDQGRYRLKSMFDTADTKAGEASHPVRMLRHLAGANYGMHFPLHAGTEVLVTCLNNDSRLSCLR